MGNMLDLWARVRLTLPLPCLDLAGSVSFQPESDPNPDQLEESFTVQLNLTTQSLSGGFAR